MPQEDEHHSKGLLGIHELVAKLGAFVDEF